MEEPERVDLMWSNSLDEGGKGVKVQVDVTMMEWVVEVARVEQVGEVETQRGGDEPPTYIPTPSAPKATLVNTHTAHN